MFGYANGKLSYHCFVLYSAAIDMYMDMCLLCLPCIPSYVYSRLHITIKYTNVAYRSYFDTTSSLLDNVLKIKFILSD